MSDQPDEAELRKAFELLPGGRRFVERRDIGKPPVDPDAEQLALHVADLAGELREGRGVKRPLALDLFCGAGGASMGLHRAGFDVIGVDIKKQPRYPFRFVQGDALNPPFDLQMFDFIWASPPCQAHTPLRKMWNSKPHADLIPQTRELLASSGVPYAIENVPGAPLQAAVRLCGTMFGLKTSCGAELRRHRYFETSFAVLVPTCNHSRSVVDIYGGHVRDRCRTITITGNTPQQNVVRNRVRQTYSIEDAKHAMGIDWMTMKGLSQSIPPAYSEFIGRAARSDQLARVG